MEGYGILLGRMTARPGRIPAILAVAALLAACKATAKPTKESLFRPQLESLRSGMTRREVQKILPPLDGTTDLGSESGSYVLVYPVSADWLVELPFHDTGDPGHGLEDLLAPGTARLVRADRRPPEHRHTLR
jgi:hypothetical protein